MGFFQAGVSCFFTFTLRTKRTRSVWAHLQRAYARSARFAHNFENRVHPFTIPAAQRARR